MTDPETRPMIRVMYLFFAKIFLADPETRYTIEALYLFFGQNIYD